MVRRTLNDGLSSESGSRTETAGTTTKSSGFAKGTAGLFLLFLSHFAISQVWNHYEVKYYNGRALALADADASDYADPESVNPPTTFRANPSVWTDGESGLGLAPSEILIEVLNPRPDCLYSVTIVSHDRYTGTAQLLPQEESKQGEEQLVSKVYSWRPILPGQYEVLVHEIDQVNSHETPLVGPSPLSLTIYEGPNSKGAWRAALDDRISNMPPCQSRPETNVYSRWEGDWLGPEFGLEESIRTGWSFLPSRHSMGCKIETFTSKDLAAIPTMKRIYVLGRSVERGVFLSLVDLMLEKKEKKLLKHSVIGKCWGRASVSKGNLEVMYQDFRVNGFEDPTKRPTMECHNERVVKQPGSSFIVNATLVWEEIFHQRDESEWPEVVFLVTGLGAAKFMFNHHVKAFVENLPPTWDGTLVLGDFSFSARDAGLSDMKQYHTYLGTIARYVDKLNDPRVRWIDGMGISSDMRMYGQKHENYVTRSQHFHYPCLMKDPNDSHKATVSCSNITETVAQLLLGHALGPKADFIESIRQNQVDDPLSKAQLRSKSQTRWCHACPKCMLPFSLVANPQMECVEGPLVANTENADCSIMRENRGKLGDDNKSDPKTCPDSCMETSPVDSFKTESDTVFVRQCTV